MVINLNSEDKKIFEEIQYHLLNDTKPSVYINKIMEDGKLSSYPFSMISDLKKVLQNPKYHPEGDTFNHVMMVIDEGVKYKAYSEDERVYMWSLLLHDIGKTPTTKLRKGRWTSYDHDKVGSNMAKEFLKKFDENEEFIEKVSALVKYHMNPLFIVKRLPFGDTDGLLKDTSLKEVALVSLSDRLGRGGMDKEKIIETKKSIKEFIHRVSVEKKIDEPQLSKIL